jgi:hypothetical protein
MTEYNEILPENIKCILSKYYEGLTSIDEERQLRLYFDNQGIPEANVADKTLLSHIKNDEFVNPSVTEIWIKIRASEEKVDLRRKAIRFYTSIAASILVIISLSIGYNLYTTKHDHLTADTFKNPEEAYKVVQKYLGLVSTKLSYAYIEMKNIEKLSIPSETMQSFSEIDINIQRLSLLDKLGSSSHEIERFSILSDIFLIEKN